jgi:acetolactate decarboxylase
VAVNPASAASQEAQNVSSEALGAVRDHVRTLLAHEHARRHGQKAAAAVYQTSTMAALLDGIYDGDVTIAELLTHGDFGLGTFNHLDGEMIVINGACYHLRSDGSASIAGPDDRTPFAAVTWFKTAQVIRVPGPASRADVTTLIDATLTTDNLIQAVRIDGTFHYVKTRTVAAQKPPYPPLTEATATEPITEFHDVTGTLAGFRTPDYEQGISVAGYHLHFINQARTHGGHSLDFTLDQGKVTISTSSELQLSLPRTEAFLKANMSIGNLAEQIHQTEGG